MDFHMIWFRHSWMNCRLDKRIKCAFDVLQVTMRQLTNQLSLPVEREGLAEELSANGRAGGIGGRGNIKEDKYGLMDNIVIESLPPMREEGPRVFIIS